MKYFVLHQLGSRFHVYFHSIFKHHHGVVSGALSFKTLYRLSHLPLSLSNVGEAGRGARRRGGGAGAGRRRRGGLLVLLLVVRAADPQALCGRVVGGRVELLKVARQRRRSLAIAAPALPLVDAAGERLRLEQRHRARPGCPAARPGRRAARGAGALASGRRGRPRTRRATAQCVAAQ